MRRQSREGEVLSGTQLRPSLNTACPWLSRFALFTALTTLALLGVGGLVTSHGAGMAVPDWPNTYGYNMFFFPISQWVGGVFYEHTHRLLASAVGLLTGILALWLYGRSARCFTRWLGLGLLALALGAGLARPSHLADALVLGLTGAVLGSAGFFWPRNEPSPKWLRRLGLAAFGAVVLQGVLGGLRVVLFKDQIGIFHATLAQLFFVLVSAIALFTSRWWQEGANGKRLKTATQDGQTHPQIALEASAPKSLVLLFPATTLLILAQLVLGATMRHQHAGLAIPDFPLAYGKLWPPMDAASVAGYNQHRVEIVSFNPITSFQIGLQMAHRLAALLILGGVASCAWLTRRRLGAGSIPARMALVWVSLILVQALLGAATIWSNKAADVATAHVLVGALSLVMGTMLCLISLREMGIAFLSSRRASRFSNIFSSSLPAKTAPGHDFA